MVVGRALPIPRAETGANTPERDTKLAEALLAQRQWPGTEAFWAEGMASPATAKRRDASNGSSVA